MKPQLSSSPKPGTLARAAVATLIAFIASSITWLEHLRLPNGSSDFGEIWFGARSLLSGANPYVLIGPGRQFEWDWVTPYPITAFVAAIPFAPLGELAASLAFVWVSAWALAFTITRIGWQRLFLIPSAAFIVAARAAQWSPLFAAIFLQPALSILLPLKPNIGGAVAAGLASKRAFLLAACGALILLGIGFALLPNWVGYWIANLRQTRHLVSPIICPGGFLVLLAALRWRRPEARLLLALALIPQTGSWYESLPVLLVAESRRECQLLSMISSVGFIASAHLVSLHTAIQVNRDVATFMIWFVYLPATAILLTRDNSSRASDRGEAIS